MSQISPPIRIVIVAAIGLVAAWMLFLRPKTEDVPAPTPAPKTAPGVKGLSKAVDKAKGAAATSDKANEKIQQATGDDEGSAAKAGKSESKSEAKTAPVSGRVLPLEPLTEDQTKGLPRKIVRALDNRKVFVVGVFDTKEKRWARMASDDRLVRRELSKVERYDGSVVVTQSSLGELSKLNAIVGDLGVSQTPSVVVVDRNRQAVVLTGFVEHHAINQVIQDARRNSTERRITDPFVRQINSTCANFFLRVDRWNAPSSRGQLKPALRRWERIMASYSAGFASLKAPAKYRGVRNQVSHVVANLETYGAALRSGNFARIGTAHSALLASDAGLNRKFADMGATSCNTDRRR